LTAAWSLRPEQQQAVEPQAALAQIHAEDSPQTRLIHSLLLLVLE
jgi:hypothetical protein